MEKENRKQGEDNLLLPTVSPATTTKNNTFPLSHSPSRSFKPLHSAVSTRRGTNNDHTLPTSPFFFQKEKDSSSSWYRKTTKGNESFSSSAQQQLPNLNLSFEPFRRAIHKPTLHLLRTTLTFSPPLLLLPSNSHLTVSTIDVIPHRRHLRLNPPTPLQHYITSVPLSISLVIHCASLTSTLHHNTPSPSISSQCNHLRPIHYPNNCHHCYIRQSNNK